LNVTDRGHPGRSALFLLPATIASAETRLLSASEPDKKVPEVLWRVHHLRMQSSAPHLVDAATAVLQLDFYT
jgi:hypothetical protein